MGIHGDYLEARNAAFLALQDHDEGLKKTKSRPGVTRKILAKNVQEFGGEPWTFNEGPWF